MFQLHIKEKAGIASNFEMQLWRQSGWNILSLSDFENTLHTLSAGKGKRPILPQTPGKCQFYQLQEEKKTILPPTPGNLFRHASVSSTYPCQSVGWSVGHTFWLLLAPLASLRTFYNFLRIDLWDIWSEWWGEMSQGCMEAWMLLVLGCMEAAMLKNVWWQQCSAKIYTDGQSGMRTEIRGCRKA